MERIIRPTIRPYVIALMILAIVIGALAFVLSDYFPNYSVIVLALGAVVVVAILFWIAKYKYDQMATEYVIRDNELVELTGVWAKDEEHVPLDKVQDFKVVRTLTQTLLGMANIDIETAAEEKTYEISFKSLSKADSDWLIEFLAK